MALNVDRHALPIVYSSNQTTGTMLLWICILRPTSSTPAKDFGDVLADVSLRISSTGPLL